MIRIALVLAAVAAIGVTGISSSAAAPAAPAQDQADIVDTAVAAGSFKTLASLLERAGLVDALRQPGPYTVFAPTDAAFARLPKGKLRSLKRHPKRLKAVLLYHVAAGRLEATDVASRKSIEMLNGKRVRIRVTDGNVFVNRARVTTPDVSASNGVIHVINRVLIPRRR
ncbi:MAG TPA: fasciclin domain-containing protein [Thermoleophilaceae bacterium]|nr:fasciclin domain-containing protein [Thermoleophilaceae bacterium]